MAEKHPKIATVDRAVRARGQKVYVDYLQNIEGKSLACAYSARASEFAGASTPLTWKEIDEGVDPRDFTIRTLPDRLARSAICGRRSCRAAAWISGKFSSSPWHICDYCVNWGVLGRGHWQCLFSGWSCSRTESRARAPPRTVLRRLAKLHDRATELQRALGRLPDVQSRDCCGRGVVDHEPDRPAADRRSTSAGTLADVAYLAYGGRLERNARSVRRAARNGGDGPEHGPPARCGGARPQTMSAS